MLTPNGPMGAKLLIAVDCVSARDLYSNTILADREFDKMLMEAGGNRASVFVTALIRDQIIGQSFDSQIALHKKAITPIHKPLHDKYVTPTVLAGLEALIRDIELVKPKVVLGLGNGVLFALLAHWGVGKWRGSVLEWTSPNGQTCHIIPTHDLSYLYRVWADRPTIVHDIRKAWLLAHSDEPITAPEFDFEIEPTFAVAARRLDKLLDLATRERLKLSVDIETRGGHCACIGIAWSATEAICIPQLRAVPAVLWDTDKAKCHYWREEEEAFLVYRIYKLLTHPNVEVVGQNFIYDAQYFYRWFMFIPRFARDTMLTQHAMFSGREKGLDVLSSLYVKHHVYWKGESKNWDPKLGERQLWIYNCKDACITYEIDTEQQRTIREMSATWPELPSIVDFQNSLFYPVLRSMNLGLRVNNESKAELSADLAHHIAEREEWIETVLGHKINIRSPVQMKDLFYRVLAQRPVISRQTHKETVDDAALEKIAAREPLLIPLCSKIRELRSLNVFRSTFLEAPTDIDTRMRCSFNIGGTETFRFSSSENAFGSGMNLQNVPVGDDDGLPNIRALFLADLDMEFFDIDLDSADLRVVTWESDCAGMKRYFAEGKKPYVEVAKEYFQDDSITKEHDAYKAFKVICHGTNYKGGAGEIASRMPKSAKVGGLDAGGIERIQQWYFQRFPEIADWQARVRSDLLSRKYVSNVFGYRIWNFDRITDKSVKEAIAAIPQSTVACLINRGYRAVYEQEPRIQVLLQVHDSLAGQYPIEGAEQFRKSIVDCCTIPLQYKSGLLIIPVGIKTSRLSWGAVR